VISLGTETTRLVLFEDEFDNGIDPDVWIYDLGDGRDRGIPGWGNSELQWYTTDNSYTENSNLVIEAREETIDNRSYTSARMTTRGTVSFDTGLLEVTAKMPEG
jgi:beta-glucanase (GH16 family)